MTGGRLADYLDQMRIAADDARRFVEGMTRQDFLTDKRTQQAVVMSLSSSARPPVRSWTSTWTSSLGTRPFLGAA
jgi:hypothetical protein